MIRLPVSIVDLINVTEIFSFRQMTNLKNLPKRYELSGINITPEQEQYFEWVKMNKTKQNNGGRGLIIES